MRNRDGFALEATIFVLVLMSVLMLSTYTGAVMATKSSNLDYRTSRVSYAAEAGADAIMAQLADALQDGYISDEELYAVTPPDIEGFTFEDLRVEKIGGVVTEKVTDGPFAGLYSLTQKLEITSEATDPMGNTSAVIVSAKAQAFPVFQFGVFFDGDLEATNLPSMDFAGWVHANGNIYLSSDNAYYHDMITTPNKVFRDWKAQHKLATGVEIDNASGNGIVLDFDSRTHPAPAAFRAESALRFDNRLMTDAYGVDSLSLPLPAGVTPYEIILARDAGDGQMERQAKYAWKADWVIEIDLAGSNPGTGPSKGKAGGQQKGKGLGKDKIKSTDFCDKKVTIRSAGLKIPKKADCQTIFSWYWEGFWDSREQRFVDVVDIDVGALYAWIAGDPMKATSTMYISFTDWLNAEDPSGDGVFPAVRLINGAQLGAPLTIATSHPLYVQGDFNTGIWKPASVVGDAITLLSSAWDDTAHEDILVVMTTPTSTTYNMAILAGHSATPCDHEDVGCPTPVDYQDWYGGGIENFPRFLENWSGRTVTYVGALVSVHEAVNPTGTWNLGNYYWPPTRNWSFDVRFEYPDSLPPGTPVVGNVIHTAFRPVY